MKQEQQAPQNQNESNAGGGMIDNPVRKNEQEAAKKVAGHPGDAGNAAGMDNNTERLKDHDDECRQGDDKDWRQ